ncbi:hypothetical protein TNCV_4082511 [Trichonephila clavipes]|nr:hypothetical protein TNCV_4082511 [Trichonephila clavipes]
MSCPDFAKCRYVEYWGHLNENALLIRCSGCASSVPFGCYRSQTERNKRNLEGLFLLLSEDPLRTGFAKRLCVTSKEKAKLKLSGVTTHEGQGLLFPSQHS